ncbi:Uncharacterized protein APZ42_032344 [Daphnia magna]|uniref:Uncharacterized protein n=1 Tax=Daphnia magna TaxID=35525 RepID=A0A164M3W5_9CRUS|nr:Uncharacterized protein APZ42_032344 [Daphnia magna]
MFHYIQVGTRDAYIRQRICISGFSLFMIIERMCKFTKNFNSSHMKPAYNYSALQTLI